VDAARQDPGEPEQATGQTDDAERAGDEVLEMTPGVLERPAEPTRAGRGNRERTRQDAGLGTAADCGGIERAKPSLGGTDAGGEVAAEGQVDRELSGLGKGYGGVPPRAEARAS
jgi:hypothetical protein